MSQGDARLRDSVLHQAAIVMIKSSFDCAMYGDRSEHHNKTLVTALTLSMEIDPGDEFEAFLNRLLDEAQDIEHTTPDGLCAADQALAAAVGTSEESETITCGLETVHEAIAEAAGSQSHDHDTPQSDSASDIRRVLHNYKALLTGAYERVHHELQVSKRHNSCHLILQ
jgi:hypothetical protein